jgi:hypothetical protein
MIFLLHIKIVQTPQYFVHQIVKPQNFKNCKTPIKVSLGSSGFEHETDENHKWE